MTSPSSERRQRSFPSNSPTVRRARQFVSEFLYSHHANEATKDAFALITSELITNFVEHGDGSTLKVSVIASLTTWELNISGDSTVIADNPILHPDTWAIASAAHSSGRGLGIVRSLCNDIMVTSSHHSIRIRCRQPR